ncbi:MAG TPA: zinc ribbon domain-containing protein [Candidatus Sumerlaeota bacterium]|jgi:predicted nucleic-acid-binding Zn-ribbon protein|nr:MAG: hypothetical protein BWY12_02047 [candidate division BRC1 bacterium ADurb.Bin183]HOE63535.1 zinc ribbon domain-containing protein [Candidatus Sumerlaeota bacterium]HRR30552.1 zinc ribbon domain-containing protein [Candidatus Sumerlaeia bacterium]HON51350.1 zinc ribbon domain-containing protein [Candidatus Sumerlaeota bacterium]HOR64597.1 zinc ribbon domain-containing protein [Candidatus Sumerlaeota bacterium]
MAKQDVVADNLQKAFVCPKCRCKDAQVRRLFVNSAGFLNFMPVIFYSVTCTLCGYTEFYDELAYKKQTEQAAEKIRAVQEI